MRGTLALGAVAAAVALMAPLATAGPLDPPPSLKVWLLEGTTRTPPPLELQFRYTPTDDWGAIVLASFHQSGRRRHLVEGEDMFYIEARRGGAYPVVTSNGVQQLPPCPTRTLCSTPAVPGDYVDATYRSHTRDLKYYLFAKDVPVSLSVGAGWHSREVTGGDLMQFRDSGTSARVSAYNRQYAVEDFHGVSAPRVIRPSVAVATIPCWLYPMPGGDGEAFLTDDGRAAGPLRHMDCSAYWWAALGASDKATVWRNDGASLGWSGGVVMRLVVAVLPP